MFLFTNIDVIDVVKDQLYGADYVKEEDPLYYVSEKSGRGPLNVNWLEEYWEEVRGKSQPLPNGKSLMCAYKLCRVEFRYWGMQTKIEKFIHDVGKYIQLTILTNLNLFIICFSFPSYSLYKYNSA